MKHQGSGGGGAGRWIFWAFLAIAAYFLITEHRAHVVNVLPYLLLLACPLLHAFHGHGRHDGRREHDDHHHGQRPEPTAGSAPRRAGGGAA